MRRQEVLIKSLSLLTTLMLALTVTAVRPRMAHAAPGKDYVIVIDISTSMEDIFDDVKRLSKRTIARASVGDNVAVITFGEEATLLDRKQIRGKSDLEKLQRRIDELYPTDYATYINQGLEKGLNELRYLFEKNPDRERVLLWLSDDKDNPPDALGDDFITLDQLKERPDDFDPGNEWFVYEAPKLDDQVENEDIEDFVMWARRTTFRVDVKEQQFDLGSFEDGNVKETVTLTFIPRHPGAAGLEFLVSARLTNRDDFSKRIRAHISPARVRAAGNTWQQKFQLSFKADPGEYSGSIAFQPIASGSLDVQPRAVNFRTVIVLPKPEIEEPAEPAEEEVSPRGLLADARDKGIIATEKRPPGTTRIDKPIPFGPLEPGKKDSKIITLYLNKEADPKGIEHDLSINLPDGITFTSRVFGKGTKLAAEMTVSVDRDIQLPEKFSLVRAYEGSVRFKSDEPGVQVLPVYIPLRLTFDADQVRWGRKMLPETDVGQIGQVKARRMTFEELTKEMEKGKETGTAGETTSTLSEFISLAGSRYILFPILAVVVVVIILLLYRLRPASEVFVGELVVIRDPSESNMKNVNLKRIGSLHDKNVLVIGNSSNADIRLGHDSVEPVHCRISARTVGGRTDIAIDPIKGNPVKINEIEYTERTTLSDKDLIGIGNFILLFSNPEAQKEVIARFLDGRTMRGTPVTWDIGTPSFELLRTDSSETEGATDEIVVINFVDLKAIFFLQDTSGSAAAMPTEMVNKDEMLEVTFQDGEKVEGFPLKDYSDTTGRFYIVPLEMPNIASVLIERSSTTSTEKKKAPEEESAAKTGGLFASLRKRKGTAPAE